MTMNSVVTYLTTVEIERENILLAIDVSIKTRNVSNKGNPS